jgi:hypothetical protein
LRGRYTGRCDPLDPLDPPGAPGAQPTHGLPSAHIILSRAGLVRREGASELIAVRLFGIVFRQWAWPTTGGCTGKYTDGSGSGSGTKYNCGYCSSKCREAAKKAPRAYAPRTQCEHGRQKHKCKDCSPKSFSCQHGRLKGRCKVQGLRHGLLPTRAPEGALQGLRKDFLQCKDCGTGYCQHGRQKDRCKDCGTGYCQHGRLNHKCRECKYTTANSQ